MTDKKHDPARDAAREAKSQALAKAKNDREKYNYRHIDSPSFSSVPPIDEFSFSLGYDAGRQAAQQPAKICETETICELCDAIYSGESHGSFHRHQFVVRPKPQQPASEPAQPAGDLVEAADLWATCIYKPDTPEYSAAMEGYITGSTFAASQTATAVKAAVEGERAAIAAELNSHRDRLERGYINQTLRYIDQLTDTWKK
jgi:hypothetical protein